VGYLVGSGLDRRDLLQQEPLYKGWLRAEGAIRERRRGGAGYGKRGGAGAECITADRGDITTNDVQAPVTVETPEGEISSGRFSGSDKVLVETGSMNAKDLEPEARMGEPGSGE
jgi:hypothetical protein